MKRLAVLAIILSVAGIYLSVCRHMDTDDAASVEALPIPADDALDRLLAGNRRFLSGAAKHPHEAGSWRENLESAQHPFAVVIGCADSRVPPELIFDQGFGDLFVIRVAGNVVDTDVTASVEYAINHLGTKLVVVMGHSGCGAVTAALEHHEHGVTEPKEVLSLIHRIAPAVSGLNAGCCADQDRLEMAIAKNVQLSVNKLHGVDNIAAACRGRGVQIVGATYDMHTGRVQILDSTNSCAE